MLNPRSLYIPSAEECLHNVQEYRADFLLKNPDHQFMSSDEDSARDIIEIQIALRNRWILDGASGGEGRSHHRNSKHRFNGNIGKFL